MKQLKRERESVYTKKNDNIIDMNIAAKKLTRWVKRLDIFKKRILAAPLNQKQHWATCFVVNPGGYVGDTTFSDFPCIYLIDSILGVSVECITIVHTCLPYYIYSNYNDILFYY